MIANIIAKPFIHNYVITTIIIFISTNMVNIIVFGQESLIVTIGQNDLAGEDGEERKVRGCIFNYYVFVFVFVFERYVFVFVFI